MHFPRPWAVAGAEHDNHSARLQNPVEFALDRPENGVGNVLEHAVTRDEVEMSVVKRQPGCVGKVEHRNSLLEAVTGDVQTCKLEINSVDIDSSYARAQCRQHDRSRAEIARAKRAHVARTGRPEVRDAMRDDSHLLVLRELPDVLPELSRQSRLRNFAQPFSVNVQLSIAGAHVVELAHKLGGACPARTLDDYLRARHRRSSFAQQRNEPKHGLCNLWRRIERSDRVDARGPERARSVSCWIGEREYGTSGA